LFLDGTTLQTDNVARPLGAGEHILNYHKTAAGEPAVSGKAIVRVDAARRVSIELHGTSIGDDFEFAEGSTQAKAFVNDVVFLTAFDMLESVAFYGGKGEAALLRATDSADRVSLRPHEADMTTGRDYDVHVRRCGLPVRLRWKR
jgi:hypothetical protein